MTGNRSPWLFIASFGLAFAGILLVMKGWTWGFRTDSESLSTRWFQVGQPRCILPWTLPLPLPRLRWSHPRLRALGDRVVAASAK
jgi:hypothetical protein